MPGLLTDGSRFKTIQVEKLHSTFGAEVRGVDWHNVTEEQFDEILQAMAQVSLVVSIFMGRH